MTTIAYTQFTLASDSASSIGSMNYEMDCKKIHLNVGPFAYIGVAGDFQRAQGFLKEIGSIRSVQDIVDKNQYGKHNNTGVEMLCIAHDDTLWSYNGESIFELRADLNYAIGTGAEYALGAMCHGATATEAVVVASKYDMYTNNVLQVYHLKENP